MAKPFAWSYSALHSFETCPHRHNLTKVSKVVSEGHSAQMDWGNKVHKALELRIKTKQPLPTGLDTYEKIALTIERAGANGIVEAEQKMGCDINYQPTGYFSPNIWVRAITDVTITKPEKRKAFVGDYKTGKRTPASAQLKLCAAMTFAAKPWLEKVTTAFIWLADGGQTSEVYTREDIPKIWGEFNPRVQRMEQALTSGVFPKNPSGLCRAHCPVPRRLCEHSGQP